MPKKQNQFLQTKREKVKKLSREKKKNAPKGILIALSTLALERIIFPTSQRKNVYKNLEV